MIHGIVESISKSLRLPHHTHFVGRLSTSLPHMLAFGVDRF